MNITEEEIDAFRGGRTFDFNGFGKTLNKAFLSGWFHGWSQEHSDDLRSFSTQVYGDRVYQIETIEPQVKSWGSIVLYEDYQSDLSLSKKSALWGRFLLICSDTSQK